MGRAHCCEIAHVNKGAWTKMEDEKLMNYIKTHGQGCWRSLPKAAGLLRCGKSCRLRWINYLRPDVKRGNFTPEEEDLIIRLHRKLGNKWSRIAGHLPGRTDNEIKNYWNTHIKRKLLSRGIDPQTHGRIAVENGATSAVTKIFPLPHQDLVPLPPLVRDEAKSYTEPRPQHHAISHGKISHKEDALRHKPTISTQSYGHRPGPSVNLPIVPLFKPPLALPNPSPEDGNGGGGGGASASTSVSTISFMNSQDICLCLHLGTPNCNPCRGDSVQRQFIFPRFKEGEYMQMLHTLIS